MEGSERELGWLAGIIDGEGSLSIGREEPGENQQSPYHYAYIQVSNSDKAVIDKLDELLDVGFVTEVPPREHQNKTHYLWRVKGASAVDLAERIKPYLVAKVEQAEILSEWKEIDRRNGAPEGQWGRRGLPDEVVEERESLRQRIMSLHD